MHTALFYYFLIVISLIAMSAAMCFCTWLLERKLRYLWCAVLFLVYILDVSLVFRRDFTRDAAADVNFFSITGLVESVLLGSLLIICMWMAAADLFNFDRSIAVIPLIVFFTGSFLCIQYISPGAIQEFCFYSMRSLLSIWLLIHLAYMYRHSKDASVQASLTKARPVYFIVAFFTAAAIAQNVMFMLLQTPLRLSSLPFMPEHNFMENAIFLSLGLYLCYHCASLMRNHMYAHSQTSSDYAGMIDNDGDVQNLLSTASGGPTGAATGGPTGAATGGPTESARRLVSDDVTIQQWIARYGISSREADVLRMLLNAKSNRDIAEEMVLSVNTIKVHVHSILHKCAMTDRRELVEAFWKDSQYNEQQSVAQ